MENEIARILRLPLLLLTMLLVGLLGWRLLHSYKNRELSDVKFKSESDKDEKILGQGNLFFCTDAGKDSSVKVDSTSTLSARSDLGNVPIIIF